MALEIRYQTSDPGILPNRTTLIKKYFVCPLTLVYDCLFKIMRKLLHKTLIVGMLPATTFSWSDEMRSDGHLPYKTHRKLFNEIKQHNYVNLSKRYQTPTATQLLDQIKIDEFYIETYDGAKLSTAEITFENSRTDQYLICFPGNFYLYEMTKSNLEGDLTLLDYLQLAHSLKQTLVLFNYRGVGLSKKEFAHIFELVIDGVAQVQRLLDNGVKAENITLYGHSKGGSVAIYVAAYFYTKNILLKLIADRTYRSSGHVSSTRGFLSRFSVETNLRILKFLNLQLSPDTLYHHLPETHRISFSLPDGLDQTIPHHVAFSSSVRDQTLFEFVPKKTKELMEQVNHHSTPHSKLLLKDSDQITLEDMIVEHANKMLTVEQQLTNSANLLHLESKPSIKLWLKYLIVNMLTIGLIAFFLGGGFTVLIASFAAFFYTAFAALLLMPTNK